MNIKSIIQLLLQCSSDLGKLHDHVINELSKAVNQSVNEANPEELFKIAKNCTPSEKDRVQTFLNAYNNAILALVKQGITQAVLLSTNTQQKALNAFTRFEGKEVDSWRKETARAFIESRMKRDHGLNLSDRVWNYTQQTKSEFEVAVSQVLSNGIGKGISAESLGRQVRQYLNNPDMMYRRYHLKKLQSDGTKIDVVEWRRRIVDKDGKVHFVKEDLERVGTGVYRSARQNALRLTITETNMAYNYSNCKRWESEPFVLGLRIRLSANHPQEDICDELAGDYPKTFMWRGWHPRCMCSISPILMDKNSEEWKKLRKLPKDEYEAYQSPNLIKDVPNKFNEWCKRNEKKLKAARKNGKLPYFVRDNEKVVGDIVGWKDEKEARRERILEAAKKRHAARTPEKEAMLREYWAKKVAEAEARRRHEAIMEAARIRHAARTPEQIADIKQRAEARLKKHALIKKTANNVLKIASKYNEVDFVDLKKYINEGNLDAMQRQSKIVAGQIAKINKDRKSLFEGGNPFSTEELSKLKIYEKTIIDSIMNGKGIDTRYIIEYQKYCLSISEKYYDLQKSIFSESERNARKKIVEKYLARDSFNPEYIWGSEIGGVYEYMDFKIDDYINKLKGLTEEELSIVKRFTNGSTFSNCYNLHRESPYWEEKFRESFSKLSMTERKEMLEAIGEWVKSADYVLDKMVRYNGITFRGLDEGGGPELRQKLTKAFESGKPWINNAQCSTSTDFKVAKDFDGDVILIIHNKTGAYIHPISNYNCEFEVMTIKGAKYKVLSPPKKVGERYYAELEEII